MQVQPYLFFEGRCEEALKFYGAAVGAKVIDLMHFKDNPDPQAGAGCADGSAPPPDKVMHASFSIGDTTLMASDGMASGKADFKGMSLSITAANDAEAKRLFNALSEGGQVQMPLTKTFFASSFGMVADRFGVSWMVIALP
ncbi:VOC family protein [Polaromonas sp.]|uniref:VOC family protein n=1 Tax=Polaromonas sp. TaxID=1869339 RepID=UPI00286A80E2|nr:VOC family protein [Polaromonas sp.]